MCMLGAVFISGTSMFLFPLGPFLGVTKALWELSAASVSGIVGEEVVTRGQAKLKSGRGMGGRGDGGTLGFHEGCSPFPSGPCLSSGEVQGMAETLSSFYFWQSYRRGVPLLCLF